MRYFHLAMGLVSLALGVFGMFIPGLPTTIFVILAAGFFSKSHPKLDSYLLNHPRWGQSIKDWRYEGAISKRGKKAATLGMLFGFVVMLFLVKNVGGLLGGTFGILFSAIYVNTRPQPKREKELQASQDPSVGHPG